jgi:two-component system response regulator EvgA
MRILLADDQADVRSALRLVVEHEGFEVAAECASFAELQERAPAVRPDLVLLDWELDGWAALDQGKKAAVLQILRERGGMRVLAMSVRPEAREQALAAGADGYVSKVETDALLAALRGDGA